MKVELRGKEVVTIVGLVCLTVLSATWHDNLLMMLFAGGFAGYAGLDRWLQVRKGKKEKRG